MMERKSKRRKRIACVYMAEDYQAYHLAPLAARLARSDWAECDSFYNYASTRNTLSRLYGALGVSQFSVRPLTRSWKTRLYLALGLIDRQREAVLRRNRQMLQGYDAIISTENTLAELRKNGDFTPPLILVDHGPIGRPVRDRGLKKAFSLMLCEGQYSLDGYLGLNLLGSSQLKDTGYLKLECCEALEKDSAKRLEAPLKKGWKAEQPFVLYNPHYSKRFQSVDAFLPTLLKGFARHPDLSLVVAPHVKFSQTVFGMNWTRPGWKALKCAARLKEDNILVDLGSDRSMEMVYTNRASVYVGDVSSQIYEFLCRPRPCVFLNPRKYDWKNNFHPKFWEMGEVVERPEELMAAILRAPARHAEFLPAQKKLMERVFSQTDQNPSERAELEVRNFLEAESRKGKA